MHALFRLIAALTVILPALAIAQEQPKLFKIVTPRDDIVIGLTAEELRGFGSGPDVDVIAQRLVSAGQVSAWQYAVGRDANGALQQAPLKRVAILRSDTLRIEPFNSPLPIVRPFN